MIGEILFRGESSITVFTDVRAPFRMTRQMQLHMTTSNKTIHFTDEVMC